MAKLTKEKFHFNGTFRSERTTDAGDIEMHLHYDTQYHKFYFEQKEYQQYTNGNTVDFSGCKTRDAALGIMKAAIGGCAEKKRFIQLRIDILGDLGIKASPFLADFLQNKDFAYAYGNGEKRISLSFLRIIRVGKDGNYGYFEANRDWSEPKSKNRFYSNSTNLIEWDEETEAFLTRIQQGIESISKQLINFFNTENFEQLKDKIAATPLLLNNPQQSQ